MTAELSAEYSGPEVLLKDPSKCASIVDLFLERYGFELQALAIGISTDDELARTKINEGDGPSLLEIRDAFNTLHAAYLCACPFYIPLAQQAESDWYFRNGALKPEAQTRVRIDTLRRHRASMRLVQSLVDLNPAN